MTKSISKASYFFIYRFEYFSCVYFRYFKYMYRYFYPVFILQFVRNPNSLLHLEYVFIETKSPLNNSYPLGFSQFLLQFLSLHMFQISDFNVDLYNCTDLRDPPNAHMFISWEWNWRRLVTASKSSLFIAIAMKTNGISCRNLCFFLADMIFHGHI